MLNKWVDDLLENCVQIIDYRGKTPNKKSEGIPLITAKIVKSGRLEEPTEFIDPIDYESWMRRGIPEHGDIILTSEAPMGEVAEIPNKKVALAQRIFTLRPHSELIGKRYLKYFIISEYFQNQLVSRSSGTTVTGIKQSELKKLIISYPPLPTQKAIAHILGTLDDKIELLRQMNETLEAMARALFQSWFVDFDPVRKKADGITTGLPKEIEDLFPSEFEDSELGEIPKGWKVGKLGDLIDFNPPYSLNKNKNYTFLEMKNIEESSSNPKIWDNKIFAGGSKFQNHDTLLARITPCLENGKTCYVQFLNESEIGFGSTEYIVMRTKDNIPKCFSYLIAKNESFRDYAISHLNGSSGRQRVEKDSLFKYQIIFPLSQTIWDTFGEISNKIFLKIHEGYLEQKILTSLRDSLLPKLISGELDLTDKMISAILESAK